MAYAYFVLLHAPVLEDLRVGLAERFPPHITIRGRFDAPTSRVAELIARGNDRLAALHSFDCDLHGPIALQNGIVWYEPARASLCSRVLIDAHVSLNGELSTLIEADWTPPEYQGRYFRPHATISFGDVAKPVQKLPETVTTCVVAWALYQYDGTRASDPGRIVYKADFASGR